jgi:hypothetical protein
MHARARGVGDAGVGEGDAVEPHRVAGGRMRDVFPPPFAHDVFPPFTHMATSTMWAGCTMSARARRARVPKSNPSSWGYPETAASAAG